MPLFAHLNYIEYTGYYTMKTHGIRLSYGELQVLFMGALISGFAGMQAQKKPVRDNLDGLTEENPKQQRTALSRLAQRVVFRLQSTILGFQIIKASFHIRHIRAALLSRLLAFLRGLLHFRQLRLSFRNLHIDRL